MAVAIAAAAIATTAAVVIAPSFGASASVVASSLTSIQSTAPDARNEARSSSQASQVKGSRMRPVAGEDPTLDSAALL